MSRRFALQAQINTLTAVHQRVQQQLASLPTSRGLHVTDIDPSNIVLGDRIGSGHYGAVFAAMLMDSDGLRTAVAIKTSTNSVDVSSQAQLLVEAHMMASLHHDHIVQLIGVVAKSFPVRLVLELAVEGNLRDFLRDIDNVTAWTVSSLCTWCVQLASAVAHLHGRNIVHRDLATR